jgi:ribosomal protein S18 acetylase RimI-like enzyme
MIGQLANKISNRYKESGLFGVILLTIKRLGIFDYLCVFYFYKVSSDLIIGNPGLPSNIDVRIVSSLEDVDEIIRVLDKRDTFRDRLNKGFFSAVIYVDNVPVGYVWGQVGPGQHREERYGFVINVETDEVYDFDSYIDPEYRGLGLMKYLTQEFIERAKNEYSKSCVTAIVEKTNLRSVRIHERLGFKRMNLQIALKIFSRSSKFLMRSYS